jgi:PhnB protein
MSSATQLKPETETGRTYVGVIPYICVSNAREATKLYEKALGAEVIDQRPTEDGRLIHSEMIINGGPFMINDPFPEHGMGEPGAGSCVLHLTVDDVQKWWDRAIAAGFTPSVEPHDAFWGDRYAQMKDAYGLTWALVGPKQ